MKRTSLKKGMTLIEFCVVIAVTAVLFADMVAFAAYINTQLLRLEGTTKTLRDAVTLSELIRADFYKDDTTDTSVSVASNDWLEMANKTLGNDRIISVTFAARTYDVDGNIAAADVAVETSDAVLICTITYYPGMTGDDISTETFTFAMVRRTTKS